MNRLFSYRNPATLNPLIGGQMRCQWNNGHCNGLINPDTGRCIMCGRSTNIAHEQQIEAQKAAAKTDWQTCSTNSYREVKLRKKYA